MAEKLGVDHRLVGRQAKAGMPMESVEAAIAWRSAHIRPRVVAKKVPAGDRKTADAPLVAVPNAYQDARTRWALAEAEEREIAVLERKGVLVNREKVMKEVAQRLSGFREALLQLPVRLAAVLTAETDEAKVHDAIKDEVYALLAQFSEGK